MKHILTSIDIASRTAICTSCGPVRLKQTRTQRWRCDLSSRKHISPVGAEAVAAIQSHTTSIIAATVNLLGSITVPQHMTPRHINEVLTDAHASMTSMVTAVEENLAVLAPNERVLLELDRMRSCMATMKQIIDSANPSNWHRLSFINEQQRTATCSACHGVVRIESKGKVGGRMRWRCRHILQPVPSLPNHDTTA